jgi:hypothetical protein
MSHDSWMHDRHEATAIILTTAERTELEGLVRSAKLKPILWAMLLTVPQKEPQNPLVTSCRLPTNAATARD